jgi:hypothetical protein
LPTPLGQAFGVREAGRAQLVQDEGELVVATDEGTQWAGRRGASGEGQAVAALAVGDEEARGLGVGLDLGAQAMHRREHRARAGAFGVAPHLALEGLFRDEGAALCEQSSHHGDLDSGQPHLAIGALGAALIEVEGDGAEGEARAGCGVGGRAHGRAGEFVQEREGALETEVDAGAGLDVDAQHHEWAGAEVGEVGDDAVGVVEASDHDVPDRGQRGADGGGTRCERFGLESECDPHLHDDDLGRERTGPAVGPSVEATLRSGASERGS